MNTEWKVLKIPPLETVEELQSDHVNKTEYQNESVVRQPDLTPVGWNIFDERNKKREARFRKAELEKRRKNLLVNKRRQSRIFSPLHLLAYGMMLFIVVLTCVNLVMETAAGVTNKNEVASLKERCQALSKANDIMAAQIDIEIDQEYIYRYATENLNMTLPMKSQIITFERVDQPYVRQNQELP